MDLHWLYKKTNQKTFRIGLFLFVFAFTFILRTHNFDRIPNPGHLEELLYGWSGIHLVETGVPVSWSTLDYPKRAEVYRGVKYYKGGEPKQSVTWYKPWLDEPPLFSYIVGWTAHQYGANRNDILPTAYIRLPSVLFAALTSILIFLIARLLTGYWSGIGAMGIYGVTPTMVFGSHLAVPENLIALLFALAIYLLLRYDIKPRLLYILPIPILAGLGGLSKPTGYFIAPFAAYSLLLKHQWKLTVYVLLATLPFIGLFIWYGTHMDAEIFWTIVKIQGFRPAGFANMAYQFSSPGYDITFLYDGWYVFCLLSAVYFLFTPKSGNKRLISLAFIYWVVVVMFSSGETDLFPWYRYPSYPLLAILGTWGIRELFNNVSFISTAMLAGLLLSSRSLLYNDFRPNLTSQAFRIFFASLVGPSLLYEIFQTVWLKRITIIVMVGIISLGVYWNIYTIYNYYDIRCEGFTCPLTQGTNISTIHFPIIWRLFAFRPL